MNRYKADLVRLMSFKDGISYGSDHTFTTEALLQITPSDVCRWMNKRSYEDSDPTDDMKPVHARSSTLEFAKKVACRASTLRGIQSQNKEIQLALTRSTN
ncbi:hypothetical protein F444_02053 [Phytophthora nicotianae P1976]|uniref:Uncharacterized protein n=1 Tax=Phytophthora nicotianae P1976 TaxID=1317066 RepID=A0A081AYP8_PHYNI|nr:hypothetical protein F444_02053 [Phytophthora nicotianae P1976]